MSIVSASANTKMDHSCNWKCCFDCRHQEKEISVIYPQPPSPAVSTKAFSPDSDLKHVETAQKTHMTFDEYKQSINLGIWDNMALHRQSIVLMVTNDGK